MRPSTRFAPVSGVAPARLRFAASVLVGAGVTQLAAVAIALGIIGHAAITEGVRAVPALRNPIALVTGLVFGAMIGAAWVLGGRLLRRGTRGGARIGWRAGRAAASSARSGVRRAPGAPRLNRAVSPHMETLIVKLPS